MRLEYPGIFRSGGLGEDAEKSACGLTYAYMRFLFAAINSSYGFYNGNERVELNDTEKQIIEAGTAEMTKIFADKGNCPLHVLTLFLPGDFETVPSGEGFMIWNTTFVDDRYASHDDQSGIATFEPGTYFFNQIIRVRSTSGQADWFHRFRMRHQNGTQLRVYENWLSGGGLSSQCNAVIKNPPNIYWTWQHFSTGNAEVMAQADSTRIEVFRFA